MKLCIVNFKKDWKPFCKAIGRSYFPDDERYATPEARAENMSSLIHEITEVFKTQDINYWDRALKEADIPHAVVPTYKEAADDEPKKANDIIIPLDHPSEGKMRTVNSPFQVSSAEKIKPGAAPKLGEHTVEVLEQIGYSEEAIRKMLDDCVIEKPVS